MDIEEQIDSIDFDNIDYTIDIAKDEEHKELIDQILKYMENYTHIYEIKWLLDNKYTYTLNMLCAWYYYTKNNNDKMLYFLLFGLENNHSGSIAGLAYYFSKIEGKKHTATKYYLTAAIKYKNTGAMHNLLVLYKQNSNHEEINNLIEKYPELITIKCLKVLDEFTQFKFLNNINKNEEQKEYFNELCKSKNLIQLKNKMHHYKTLNLTEQCFMCLDNVHVIGLNCYTHKVCKDCLFECKDICIECKI